MNILTDQLLSASGETKAQLPNPPSSENNEPVVKMETVLSSAKPVKQTNPLAAINEAVNLLDGNVLATMGNTRKHDNNLLLAASMVNRPRWQRREDVFLVGVVLDTYYRRHSLKPTKDERENAIKNKLNINTLVWQIIHGKFEKACRRFQELTGKGSCPRTLRALQKRWKSKSKIICKEESEECLVPPTKRQEREWDAIYNRDFLLTCPEHIYQEKKLRMKPLYQRIIMARDNAES